MGATFILIISTVILCHIYWKGKRNRKLMTPRKVHMSSLATMVVGVVLPF